MFGGWVFESALTTGNPAKAARAALIRTAAYFIVENPLRNQSARAYQW
jgi:hypothetical protein